MVNYWDRLGPELKARKMSRQQFADALGVSYQAVKKVADGGSPGSENNLKAAKLLGLNPLWLATGEDPKTGFNLADLPHTAEQNTPPTQSGQAQTATNNVAQAELGATKVPVISFIQAGSMTEIVDNFAPGDAEEWLLTDQKLSGCSFALEIKGDSMLPEFKPGDKVIIDPEVQPQPGDYVVAKNGTNEATFKKYRPRGRDSSGNEVFELVPLNDDFAVIKSDTEPVRIIGTMIEHRKYRKPR